MSETVVVFSALLPYTGMIFFCGSRLVWTKNACLLLGVTLFGCALSAFPQNGRDIDRGNPWEEQTSCLKYEGQRLMTVSFPSGSADSTTTPAQYALDPPTGGAESESAPIEIPQVSKPGDVSRSIYYRNKLEFSLDGGYLPINVPFPLDIFVGDYYNTYPLKYTLVPIFASLRWHLGGPWGPSILRGNFDLTFTGSITGVARGPESRYFAYLMGIRRNFIPRRGKIAPYFDVRLGVGRIDAKGPQGVPYAQGQDLTFTVNMGSGVRYNFSPRYAISAGLNFMHISNLDLSEHPWTPQNPTYGVRNYGINVYGPMIGLDIQLPTHHRRTE